MGEYDYPNTFFVEQLTERLEHSATAYSLDDVLSKTVDHYNHTRQIAPAKRDPPTDKPSDGNDSKKKGDKSVAAHAAIRDGDTSSETCQLCHLNHSATNCPLFRSLKA